MHVFSSLCIKYVYRIIIYILKLQHGEMPNRCGSKGPPTQDAIRQRDAIFRFSLTDNIIIIIRNLHKYNSN
jgi:hypothetical protein